MPRRKKTTKTILANPKPAPEPVPVVVCDDSISKYSKGITLKVKTNRDILLRTGPSKDDPVIAHMPKGSSVIWKGYSAGDNYHVYYGKYTGYVNSKYLGR